MERRGVCYLPLPHSSRHRPQIKGANSWNPISGRGCHRLSGFGCVEGLSSCSDVGRVGDSGLSHLSVFISSILFGKDQDWRVMLSVFFA